MSKKLYDHVILLGLDGLGSYGLQRALSLNCVPLLQSLMSKARSTLNARTIFPPVSAPVWTLVLSGLMPDQSGVVDNAWRSGKSNLGSLSVRGLVAATSKPGSRPATVADLLLRAKPSAHVHVAVSWPWLVRLFSGIGAHATIANGHHEDARVADDMQKMMLSVSEAEGCKAKENRACDGPAVDADPSKSAEPAEEPPHFWFVHLDDVDAAGHEFGWLSNEQIEACTRVDRRVCFLFEGICEVILNAGKTCLVIIVADHGGEAKAHGEFNPAKHDGSNYCGGWPCDPRCASGHAHDYASNLPASSPPRRTRQKTHSRRYNCNHIGWRAE